METNKLIPNCTHVINNDSNVHCLVVEALQIVHDSKRSMELCLEILNMKGTPWLTLHHSSAPRPQKSEFIAKFNSTSGLGNNIITFLMRSKSLPRIKATQILRDLKKKIIFFADQVENCGLLWGTKITPDVEPQIEIKGFRSKKNEFTNCGKGSTTNRSDVERYVNKGLNSILKASELTLTIKDRNGRTHVDRLHNQLRRQEILTSFYKSKLMRELGVEPMDHIGDPRNYVELELLNIEADMQLPGQDSDVSAELTRRYLNVTYHRALSHCVSFYEMKVNKLHSDTRGKRKMLAQLASAIDDEHVQDYNSPACKKIRSKDPKFFSYVEKQALMQRKKVQMMNA